MPPDKRIRPGGNRADSTAEDRQAPHSVAARADRRRVSHALDRLTAYLYPGSSGSHSDADRATGGDPE